MTSEEKAKQLIYKHHSISGIERFAKGYALITVNEIIEQWEYIDTYLANGCGNLSTNLAYWHEVKKYIIAYNMNTNVHPLSNELDRE
jgi:hypothetical protein